MVIDSDATLLALIHYGYGNGFYSFQFTYFNRFRFIISTRSFHVLFILFLFFLFFLNFTPFFFPPVNLFLNFSVKLFWLLFFFFLNFFCNLFRDFYSLLSFFYFFFFFLLLLFITSVRLICLFKNIFPFFFGGAQVFAWAFDSFFLILILRSLSSNQNNSAVCIYYF